MFCTKVLRDEFFTDDFGGRAPVKPINYVPIDIYEAIPSDEETGQMHEFVHILRVDQVHRVVVWYTPTEGDGQKNPLVHLYDPKCDKDNPTKLFTKDMLKKLSALLGKRESDLLSDQLFLYVHTGLSTQTDNWSSGLVCIGIFLDILHGDDPACSIYDLSVLRQLLLSAVDSDVISWRKLRKVKYKETKQQPSTELAVSCFVNKEGEISEYS